MDPRPGKHTKEIASSPDGLCAPTPTLLQTRNAGYIGKLLKVTEKGFHIDSWKQPQSLSKDPNQTLTQFSEKIDDEMEWLRGGLEQAANTGIGPITLSEEALKLIFIDRNEYNANSLDAKKRKVMERIHRIQEYFARGIIAMDIPALEKLSNFTDIFQSFPNPEHQTGLFLASIIHAAGRIMGDADETKSLIKFQKSPDIHTDDQEVIAISQNFGEGFSGYQKSLVYRAALRHIYAVMGGFLEQNLIPKEDYAAIKLRILVPMEVNFEEQKGFGVGMNMFTNPTSYVPPHSEQLGKVLDTLTATKTNIIPGGSEEAPVDYEAHVTEGMKLHDVWGIKNIHMVGKHPTPITKDSPLYLHIAMERTSGQPPFYAYYNIRTNQLFLVVPDGLNIGGTAELHLHMFALITDMRHLERSGVSQQGSQQREHTQGNTMRLPQKRSFVVRKEGIEEGPAPEPTGSVFITPREATLPYGSQFMAAQNALAVATAENNTAKIATAREKLHQVARRLPEASAANLDKYRRKAEQLGLDPNIIKIRDGRIYAAPRHGYDHPIYTTPETVRRLRAGFGSKIIEVNQLFSVPEQTTDSTDTPPPTRNS